MFATKSSPQGPAEIQVFVFLLVQPFPNKVIRRCHLAAVAELVSASRKPLEPPLVQHTIGSASQSHRTSSKRHDITFFSAGGDANDIGGDIAPTNLWRARAAASSVLNRKPS